MARIGAIDPATYNDDQRRVHAEIARLRDNAVRGPFSAWIRLPGVAEAANRLGDALRREDCLPLRLYRLAALVSARHWTAQYAWEIHASRAVEAGLDPTAVEAIRNGRQPQFEDAEDRTAHTVLFELLDTRSLSEATCAEGNRVLGEDCMVALVATAGFFGLACMTVAAFDIPAPGDARPLTQGS